MVAWCFACRYAGDAVAAATVYREAAIAVARRHRSGLRHGIAKQPRIAPAPLPRDPTSPR